MKKAFVLLALAAVVAIGWIVWNANRQTDSSDTSTPGKKTVFNTKQHSLDDPASEWVVVNKRRPLQPSNYEPADLTAPDVPLRLATEAEEMQLRAKAAAATKALFAGARAAGYQLLVSSGFRSYSYQRGLYNTYVSQQGRATADTQSARPGHSEHQTGWAVDVAPASRECEIEACFGNLPEGQWVAANAYKYGFIIRYAEGKDAITGYVYEPWHLRYVGKPLAAEIHKQGNPTLESFFKLPPAPDYQ